MMSVEIFCLGLLMGKAAFLEHEETKMLKESRTNDNFKLILMDNNSIMCLKCKITKEIIYSHTFEKMQGDVLIGNFMNL